MDRNMPSVPPLENHFHGSYVGDPTNRRVVRAGYFDDQGVVRVVGFDRDVPRGGGWVRGEARDVRQTNQAGCSIDVLDRVLDLKPRRVAGGTPRDDNGVEEPRGVPAYEHPTGAALRLSRIPVQEKFCRRGVGGWYPGDEERGLRRTCIVWITGEVVEKRPVGVNPLSKASRNR